MKNINDKRNLEKEVVAEMIALYCRKNHHSPKGSLCAECSALRDYAFYRSDVCPFMETKTFCSNCAVHCYSPQMREQIKTVMRFSAPRMLTRRPIMSIRHLILMKQEKRKLNQAK